MFIWKCKSTLWGIGLIAETGCISKKKPIQTVAFVGIIVVGCVISSTVVLNDASIITKSKLFVTFRADNVDKNKISTITANYLLDLLG